MAYIIERIFYLYAVWDEKLTPIVLGKNYEDSGVLILLARLVVFIALGAGVLIGAFSALKAIGGSWSGVVFMFIGVVDMFAMFYCMKKIIDHYVKQMSRLHGK